MADFVKAYLGAAKTGREMRLYLRLWRVGIGASIDGGVLDYSTEAHFSGYGEIDEYVPTNPTQNLARTIITCPLSVSINKWGHSERAIQEEGALGEFVLSQESGSVTLNLPELMVGRILELQRHFPEQSHFRDRTQRFFNRVEEEMRDPGLDTYLTAHFEPKSPSPPPKDAKQLVFKITYVSTIPSL